MVATEREVFRTVTVTPAGTVVYFQDEPRQYRIHAPYRGVTADSHDHEGLVVLGANAGEGWQDVPSVTEVLDTLYKPLQWWGMETGVEGVMTLHQLGLLREVIYLQRPHLAVAGDELSVASVEDITTLLTKNQLTVNHVRDRAGDRGIAVHDALEGWVASGLLPDPNMYSATEVGYVRGLRAFLADADPEPLHSEVTVASPQHGYAGRYDLRLRVRKPRDVVAHCYPKRAPLVKRLPQGEILADLKTSKHVYDSHPRQLEAYEEASLESGYEPTMARGILHVLETGQYEFVRSWADFLDFLAVLGVWRSNQRMKTRKPKGIG